MSEIYESGRIDSAGRVVIPAAVRQAMGLAAGDEILLHFDGTGLRLYTRRSAVRQLQSRLREIAPDAKGVVAAFLRERRAEAAREDAKFARPGRRPRAAE